MAKTTWYIVGAFSSLKWHTMGLEWQYCIFPTTLLVYRSAIYPQGMTFKYGLGGRLARPLLAYQWLEVGHHINNTCMARPTATLPAWPRMKRMCVQPVREPT